MNHKFIEQLLAVPSFCLSVLSFCASFYVCVASLRFKSQLQFKSKYITKEYIDNNHFNNNNNLYNYHNNANTNDPNIHIGGQNHNTTRAHITTATANNYKKRRKLILNPNAKQSNDYLVVDIIFWMSFFDLFYCIFLGVSYTSNAFNRTSSFFMKSPNESFEKDYLGDSKLSCVIVGIGLQFFAIASPLWHVLIAWCLFFLLIGYRLDKLANQKIWHVIFIMLISIIFTILPAFADKKNINHYGQFYNFKYEKEYYSPECWIIGEYQLLLWVLVLISLIFHYITLITACIKYKKTRAFTKAYLYLIRRLSAWVFVYTVVRIFPTIERVWVLVDQKNVPLWLVLVHHWFISSLGIANAAVWYVFVFVFFC